MPLSTYALALLGADVHPSPSGRPSLTAAMDAPSPPTATEQPSRTSSSRPPRSSRRPTSHYNTFQTVCVPSTDSPPSYTNAIRHKLSSAPLHTASDRLPPYTCTVSASTRILLDTESVSPFHPLACERDFTEVHLVLRGPLLSIHRTTKDNKPGRILRKYTLQHAEVGLAPDTSHTVLVPRTRLAHLVPSAARRKAWQKDPDLFEPVRQHLLRLRVETDQLVFAHPDEQHVHELVNAISAGIDIACAIDERSLPRQCTVPRRRRRPRQTATTTTGEDLSDPALLAEQERILRSMYPRFAEQTDAPTATTLSSPPREETEPAAPSAESAPEPASSSSSSSSSLSPSPQQDDDDLDLSDIREENDPASRPAMLRAITTSSLSSSFTTSSTSSFTTDPTLPLPPTTDPQTGKWLWTPSHPHSAQQISRYIRRCMPLLPADAPRATNILVTSTGRRVRVNWKLQMLEEWTLQPPAYRAHEFAVQEEQEEEEESAAVDVSAAEDRLSTQREEVESGRRLSRSTEERTTEEGEEVVITPVGEAIHALDVAKVVTSASTRAGGLVTSGEKMRKRRAPHPLALPHLTSSPAPAPSPLGTAGGVDIHAAETVHGIVFCF